MRVDSFLKNTDKRSIFLSVMTVGEICKGIAALPATQRRSALQIWLEMNVRQWFAGRILPVTEGIAERWGHLTAAAKQSGSTLPVVDGIIGATALHHDLVLVTRNVKDFDGLGIDIFNPWAVPPSKS